jgi:hypothetical protein
MMMKNNNSHYSRLKSEVTDNMTVSRMLIQLIDRYLNEKDDAKKREIFSELTSLRQLSMLLNKGRR